PDPDGPSIVKNSPCAISRSTSSTATTSPNSFLRPMSETSGAARCAAWSTADADCVANRSLHDLEAAVEVLIRGDQRHQDAKRVAADRAAQPARRHTVHDLCAPGDRRQRHAAAERLAGYEQVGLDAPLLDCPEGAGAADAGLHLVVDVDDAVLLADRLERADEV